MPFQIMEILESQPEKIRALVKHGSSQFPALIAGKQAEDLPVGKSFPAVMGFDGIVGWNAIDDFEDARSGIWQEADGIHLLGRVHSIVDFGDGRTMIEVYLENGPEVFTLDLEMMEEETFENDSGLEVTVGKLYLYPNDE